MTIQYSFLLVDLNLQCLVSTVDKIIAGMQVNILPFIRATLTLLYQNGYRALPPTLK